MAVLASFSYESFIGRTWALVVISIALFGVCVSLWMMVSCDWWRAADAHLPLAQVYVFLKMCDGTLTGNQSMGVLLLLGVIVTFASTVPWLLPPSEVTSSQSERGMWSRDPLLTPHWSGYLRGAALPPPARLLPLLRAAAAQGDAAQVPRVRGARRHHPTGINLLSIISTIYYLQSI